jgi:RNA polymerase sigma factor (sigma-70 family)
MTTPERPKALAENLFLTRGADLLRYIRLRLRSDAEARDIAQEAFLRFLRLTDPERLQNPDAYIFRIAGNLLWERRLRERPDRESAALEADELVAEHTPLDLVVAAQDASRVRRVLATLSPLARAIVILHLRDGLTFAAIAAHTGIKISLAKKHYYRSLVACRAQLETLDEPRVGHHEHP